jgi:hypothetical protein
MRWGSVTRLRVPSRKISTWDGPQPPQDVVEPVVGERERVAARDHHVADLGVERDVGQALLDLALGGGAGRVGHLALAGAVAAVDRAVVGRIEEDPVRVAVGDAGHRHVALLGQRVVEVGGRVAELAHGRHRLEPHRAGRVLRIHQGRVVGGDPHVELGVGLDDGASLVVGEADDVVELRERGDPLALLPVPVVPLVVGDALPDGARGVGEAGADVADRGRST